MRELSRDHVDPCWCKRTRDRSEKVSRGVVRISGVGDGERDVTVGFKIRE